MAPLALIFGANGQDGHYLRGACQARGMTVVGVSRAGPWVRGDVADFGQVETLVREHRPAWVFHVAANSTTRHDVLFENHATISTGALNVLEAVKRHRPEARVLLAGSGLQFRNTGAPIREDDPFEANSAYAVARIQATFAARYYRTLGVRAYVAYLFHHESPRRQPKHVSQVIVAAARRIAAGGAEPVELGDVTVAKEWTFAGDVAEGMCALLEQDVVTEANVGSGQAHTIEEWLAACFGVVGRDWREHTRLREGFVAEYPRLVSDPARIRALGWRPKVGLPELARLMVRENVAP